MSFDLHDKLDFINSCFKSEYDESIVDILGELKELLQFGVSDKDEIEAANEAVFFKSNEMFFGWLNQSSSRADDQIRLTLLSLLKMWTEKVEPLLVMKYSKAAFDNLFVFVKQANTSAKVLQSACKCLESILTKCSECGSVEIAKCDQLFADVFTRIRSGKEKSLMVQEALLELLGTLASNQPKVVESQRKKFEEIMVNGIKNQVESRRKFELTLTTGYIAALNGFYMQFAPSPAFEQKVFSLISVVLQTNSFAEMSRYSLQTVALRFLKLHLDKFSSFLLDSYPDIYTKIDFYVQQNNPALSHSAHEAMISFQEALVASMPMLMRRDENKSSGKGKALFVFMYEKLFATFTKADAKPKQLALAIEGLGRLSPFCDTFLGSAKVCELFSHLVEKCKQIRLAFLYQSSSEFSVDSEQSANWQRMQYYPNIVKSLAEIILSNEIAELFLLAESNSNAILSFCTFLISRFPYQLPPQQSFSSKAILSMIGAFNLRKLDSESCFLSHFWMQCLIRACQHSSVNALIQIGTPDSSSGEKVLSYKNYIPFIEYLLTLKNYFALKDENFDDDHLEQCWRKVRIEFMETVLKLVEILNLKAKKSQSTNQSKQIETNMNLTVEKPSDVEIFVNLADIWSTISSQKSFASGLIVSEVSLVVSCVEKLLDYAREFPHLSGWFKLLTNFLALIYSSQKEAETDTLKDVHGRLSRSLLPFLGYLQNEIDSFSNEMLIAALTFVLKCPVELVLNCDKEMNHVRKIVETAFSLQYMPLAKTSLEFLQSLISEYYESSSKKQKLLEISKSIAPKLYPYLCVETSDSLEDKSHLVSLRKKQSRSKIKHLVNTDLSEVDPEEMRNFQERVIIFLSFLPMPIEQIFVRDESECGNNLISINGLDDAKMTYAVPFRDTKPKIKFDNMLLPIIKIAENSPNRKSKVAACELLHALAILTVGKNAQMRSAKNLISFVSIYEVMFPALIRLAADNDSIANQLFEPLCFQCIHWFTSAASQESPETACLISSIFDQLSSEHSSAVRNFAAKCLKEVFEWSIKHCPKDEHLLKTTRLKHICKIITFNAKNPSLKLKMSAIVAFETCKRTLREHKILVDAFAMEWLFAFLDLLRWTDNCERSSGISKQASEVLRGISRIICKYSALFEKSSNVRRIPFGLKDATLKDTLGHLILRMRSPEIEYRRAIVEIIGQLWLNSSHVSSANFFKHLTHVSGCIETFESSLSRVPNFKKEESNLITDFLNSLLALVDCYLWSLENVKLDFQSLLNSENTELWSRVSAFLKFVSCDAFDETKQKVCYQSYSKQESFEKVCANITVGLMNLLCSMNRKCRSKDVAKLLSGVFGEEYCNLICTAIFTPNQLGLSSLGRDDFQSFSQLLSETSKIVQSLSTARIFLESKIRENIFVHSKLNAESFVLIQRLKEENSGLPQRELISLIESCVICLRSFQTIFSQDLRQEISKSLLTFLTSSDSTTNILRSDLVQKILELSWEFHFEPSVFAHLVTRTKASGNNMKKQSLFSRCQAKFSEKCVGEIEKCASFLLQIQDGAKLMKFIGSALDTWFINRQKWEISNTERNKSITTFLNVLDQICKIHDVEISADNQLVDDKSAILINLVSLDSEKVLNKKEHSSIVVEHFCSTLQRKNVQLSSKCRSLDLLPFLLNVEDQIIGEKAFACLNEFTNNELNVQEIMSCNVNECSFLNNNGSKNYIKVSFEKLFFALRITSNHTLLKLLIAPVCREQKFPYLEQFNASLESAVLASKWNVANVSKIFEETLNMALGSYTLMPQVRRRVFERVLKPLINRVSTNVFKQTFLQTLEKLIAVIEFFENLNPLNRANNETILIDKVLDLEIVLSIFEAAVQILPPTEFSKLESELNQKFHAVSKRDGKMSFMKFLLQTSANCKNQVLIPPNVPKVDRDICRQLACVAYQCLTSVIMNCVNKSEFFVSFLLDEKPKNQKLWLSVLIETDSMFQFAAEVTSRQAVKMKRLELRSRRSFRRQHSGAMTSFPFSESGWTQRNYLSSLHIQDSSVREELAQFDFNDASVRLPPSARQEAWGEPDQEPMDVDGESRDTPREYLVPNVVEDPVTSLPIFTTVVHIVKHLSSLQQKSEASSSVLPVASQHTSNATNLPNWVGKFQLQLQTAQHVNVLVFVAKVLILCEDDFAAWADSLLPDLIRVLEMYLSQSKLITSFVVELTCLVADWYQLVKAHNSAFQLGKIEKSSLDRIFTLMVQHAAHSNSALMKNNLELLKILMENFKCFLEFDFNVIYDKLRLTPTEKSPELESGIQILGLIAAHKCPTFPRISIIERCTMFQSLTKHLTNSNVRVYAPVAETVGLILSFYRGDATDELLFEELNKTAVQALVLVKQSEGRVNSLGRFFSIFSYICDRFSQFGSEMVDQAFFCLSNLTGRAKVDCLNVIYHHCTTHPNAFLSLKSHGILSNMLSNLDSAVQFASLRVLHQMVQVLTEEQYQDVLDVICRRASDHLAASSSRLKMFQILMEMHKKSKDSNLHLAKSVLRFLIRGVGDSDKVISLAVLTYISKLDSLPESVSERILSLFHNFYNHEHSSVFIKYCINVIFDACSRSPDYSVEMFEHPLDKCSFESVPIQNAWLNHHSGLLPMFIDTQPLVKVTESWQALGFSQSMGPDSSSLSSSSNASGNIRATLQNKNMQFTATNVSFEASQTFSWLDNAGDGSNPSQGESSQASYESTLVADVRNESKRVASNRGKRRVLVRTENGFKDVIADEMQDKGGTKVSARDRVRLTVLAKRDSNEEKSYFVKKAYDAAKERNRTTIEASVRKANEVVIYRNYRVGDIPDIQIKHSDLIVPLLALAQNEPTICSQLFVQVCEGVIANMVDSNSVDEGFWAEISEAFSAVLNECQSNGDQLLVQSIISIAAKWPAFVKLDSKKLVMSSIENKQELFAVAYLEQLSLENIEKSSANSVASVKRRKLDENYDVLRQVNFSLVKLFRSIGDFDHTHSFQVGNFPELTKQLIKLENSRKYKQAILDCKAALEECKDDENAEDEELWNDILVRSVSSLCDWKQLASLFDSELNLEENDHIFSGTHYKSLVDAKCKALLDDLDVSDDFCSYLEKVTNDAASRKEFSRRFPLDMSLVLVKQGYPFNAKDIIRSYALPQLQFSLRSLMFPRGLTVTLDTERCPQFHPLSQLIKFLCSNHQNLTQEKSACLIEEVTKSEMDPTTVSTSTWEEVRLVRKICLEFLTELSGSPDRKLEALAGSKMVDYNIDFALAAVKQSRIELANRVLNQVRSAPSINVNLVQAFECELMNVDYLVKVASIHDNPKVVETHFRQSVDALISFLKTDVVSNHANYNKFLSALARSFLSIHNFNPTDSKLVSGITPVHNQKFPNHFMLPWSPDCSPRDLVDASYKTLQTCCAFPMQKDDEVSAKSFFDLAKFCVNFLDSQSEHASENEVVFAADVLRSLLTSVCEALRCGKVEASALFPRLVALLAYQMPAAIEVNFEREVSKVPTWMFLSWVEQIMSYVSEPNLNKLLKPVIIAIATDYPQAVYFPFKTTLEATEKLSSEKTFVQQVASLVKNEVLERVLQELEETALTPLVALSDLMKEFSKLLPNERIAAYSKLCNELFGEQDSSAEIVQSLFKKQLAANLKPKLEKFWGPKGSKLKSKEMKSIRQDLDQLRNYHSDEFKLPSTLAEYSGYLANFSEINPYSSVELPGQYDGKNKPDTLAHVKISGFRNEVRVLESIRKPRKICILGSDEREYSFLLKGGEDLRQDDRLMKVFKLMNKFLEENSETKQRKLVVHTYDVTPMTLKLGLIQWVPNTTTYQMLFEQACGAKKVDDAKKNMHKKVTGYLGPGKDFQKFFYLWTKGAKQSEAQQCLRESSSKIGELSFRKAIEKLSVSADAFIVLRDRFIRSYSCMSLAHYILGIGDRHTSNTLVDLKSCSAVGIDFGHAFGTATQFLPVPELTPFRMTPLMAGLTVPKVSPSGGIVHATMLKTLEALQDNQEALMNILQVFLREPVIDWVEFANRQVHAMRRAGNLDEHLDDTKMSWYPQQKLNCVKRKLNGGNPMLLMKSEELDLNSLVMKDSASLLRIIIGEKGSERWSMQNETSLNTDQQVTCLIDQATDPNILGRTWIGWSPFA